MKPRIALLFVAICFFVECAVAQSKSKKVNYEKNPVWINLMNDTTANFYETVTAFREYYKERPLPKEPFESEENEVFEKEIGLEEEWENGEKSEREKERERERERRKHNQKEPNYAAEVRAFKGWYYESKLWLREDGTIIGPWERQHIVDRQHQELLEIEKANGKK